jgi:hypothetical protein
MRLPISCLCYWLIMPKLNEEKNQSVIGFEQCILDQMELCGPIIATSVERTSMISFPTILRSITGLTSMEMHIFKIPGLQKCWPSYDPPDDALHNLALRLHQKQGNRLMQEACRLIGSAGLTSGTGWLYYAAYRCALVGFQLVSKSA